MATKSKKSKKQTSKSSSNPLVKADPSQFAEVLNRATPQQMRAALKVKTLTPKKRARIEVALAHRTKAKGAAPVGDSKPAATTVAPEPQDAARANTARPSRNVADGLPSKTTAKLSGLDAAAQVLGDEGRAMNTTEMVELMLARGLWFTTGKTPAATIYAAIIREIAAKGDAARFRKTDRGMFKLAI